MKVKNKGQMSFSEIREMVSMAICAKEGAAFSCYIVDLFPDSVVYESCGADGKYKYYQRSYTIKDREATLGDAAEVERQVEYVPMQAAGQFLAAVGDPASDDYGFTWEIQICKYGLADGRAINWPREPLVAAIKTKYEGARVFCLMDTQHVTEKDRACGKSVREIVGWVENVRESAAKDALVGDFQILKSAQFLRDMVVDAFARGKTDLIGFSHDVTAKAVTKLVAGKKVKEPTEIMGVEIDVVYSPTNEGKFLQMVAASGREEEGEMLEKLLAALKRKRPGMYAQNQGRIDAGTITEDEVVDLLAAAPGSGGLSAEDVRTLITESLQAAGGAQMNETLQTLQLQTSRSMVTTLLAASGLPASTQGKLKKRFNDQIVAEETLQAAIQAEKEDIDQLTASGSVQGFGETRVVRDTTEKLQAAMDRTFGVAVADNLRDVVPFESLRAAYTEMTGDADVRGILDPAGQRRLHAAGFDSSTFAYALGNTLYRRLVQDYREVTDYGVSRLISLERNARDFRNIESVKVGYFGDLPDVNPENDDYADLGTVGDDEIIFAVNQKGGIVTITRKMIINDDTLLVQRIMNRIPRAARRTLASRIWNKFIGNATYQGDNKAIFHTDHGNLGSAAYSIAAALAGKTAMAQQTEPGSGARLQLRPVTVVHPSELYGLVKNVNDFAPQAVAVENGNSMFGFFKPEGIIENPLLTDANDWYMFADPKEVEIIEMAYLNGQREPEMFVADNPAVGQMFVADKIQYKVRHEYEAEVVDFRGCYKGVVAP